MKDMSYEIEVMAAFFNKRVEEYEAHMRSILDMDGFYGAVAGAFPVSGESINILDLGCGTGRELSYLFRRMPGARITGIDIAAKMLEKLQDTYRDRMEQITLIRGDYAAYPLGKDCYDYAASVQSLHHFPPEEKTVVYRKIHNALKTGGAYVEGDYVVNETDAQKYLNEYRAHRAKGNDGLYHLDVPVTLDTQDRLLRDAGFVRVEVLYHEGAAAVMKATKG
jgi:tRNA (cmo5U34)-methyltransferase